MKIGPIYIECVCVPVLGHAYLQRSDAFRESCKQTMFVYFCGLRCNVKRLFFVK